ncbi:MAG: hypothetical protein ABW019_13245 [Chitinophagaceae bacterium]
MRFILFACLFISTHSVAQWKSYIIGVRGDTLNRVDLKDKKQGPWVVHVDPLRGEPGYDEQGYFIDDVKNGQWVRFSLMGDKIAEENYRWGSLDGRSRYYTRYGALLREESWRAVDPTKSMDTVDVLDVNDPTKVVDRVEVKLTGQTYKHGEWTYYDTESGAIEKTERYFLDKLQIGDGGAADDEQLKPIGIVRPPYRPATDSLGNKAVPKPQVALDYEKKNSGKKKIRTRNGQTGF